MPTPETVFATELLPTLITESVNEYSLVTKARVPSALTATWVGELPTGMFAVTVFEAALMTDTELPFRFVTKAWLPSGVKATQLGNKKPEILATMLPEEMACTVTVPLYSFATYK